jgi:sugar phosphate isomerase/epimerase
MKMKRRDFIRGMACLPIAVNHVIAREPVKRSGPARFRPSLAAYSLRDYFSFMKGRAKQPKADGKPIDMFGFIDYCASIGSDAAELTSYFMPPELDNSYLLELKQHAFMNGITISGTAIGNDFTVSSSDALQTQIDDTIAWIERAAVLGAPHIRIFAGTAKQLGESKEKMASICDAVNRCAQVAEKHGVALGVENHGGITSGQLLEVMKRVESDWVGINLDTGNFISDDPYRDMEVCAPYAVNVQFKPSLRGPDKELYAADFGRIAKILRDANYCGFVALEYEEEKPYERIPDLFRKMMAALA